MAADAGAKASCYSVNHGSGRMLGRREAKRTLDQAAINQQFDADDILTNCRRYPKDEAPAAYKDIEAVMAAQADLVEVLHTLRQVVCVKG